MYLKKIANCARCGGEHADLEAAELMFPIWAPEPSEEVLYTHWVPCPTNGEPILVVEVAT